jgi:DnaJ-class molecular chaperone
MSPMSQDPFSSVPEGMRWCPHCNGYGSSLKEDAERCTRCAGTGLVIDEAAAPSAEHAGNGPPSGDEPRAG